MDITKRLKGLILKNKLWSLFDKEINEDQLECVYSSTPREYCDRNSMVKLSDEGFKICSNNKCGIKHKDILDNTAEWRYCGSKIQMQKTLQVVFLLIHSKESSYGCKVLREGGLVMK